MPFSQDIPSRPRSRLPATHGHSQKVCGKRVIEATSSSVLRIEVSWPGRQYWPIILERTHENLFTRVNLLYHRRVAHHLGEGWRRSNRLEELDHPADRTTLGRERPQVLQHRGQRHRQVRELRRIGVRDAQET